MKPGHQKFYSILILGAQSCSFAQNRHIISSYCFQFEFSWFIPITCVILRLQNSESIGQLIYIDLSSILEKCFSFEVKTNV